MEELQQTGLSGRQIDFLYVDEAQDNLIVDAACTLLLHIPSSGTNFPSLLLQCYGLFVQTPMVSSLLETQHKQFL